MYLHHKKHTLCRLLERTTSECVNSYVYQEIKLFVGPRTVVLKKARKKELHARVRLSTYEGHFLRESALNRCTSLEEERVEPPITSSFNI